VKLSIFEKKSCYVKCFAQSRRHFSSGYFPVLVRAKVMLDALPQNLSRIFTVIREPRAVSIAIVVVFLGVDLSWWSGRYSLHGAGPASPALQQSVGSSSALGLLFGAAPEATPPSEAVTSLAGVSLSGTMAFENSQGLGFAIVAVNGATQLVTVGASLAGGRLSGVFADHIVIDQSGRFVTVNLPKTKQGYGALSDDGAPSAPAGPPIQDPSGDEIKSRVARASAPLSTVLRAEPLLSDDAYRGLVVNPNGNAFAFAHLGLKPGDSIMAVNGIPLTQDNLQLLPDEMRSGHPVKVSLMRPGVGMVEVSLNMAGVYVGPKG
jgi:type II secretion system protein C